MVGFLHEAGVMGHSKQSPGAGQVLAGAPTATPPMLWAPEV